LAKYAKNNYKNFSFKFLVVGEGPMRENVTEVIKHLDLENEVIMLGHREDIPELLRAMDIFLFTADRREGVPQSLMQALLMNIPSVSTNDGSTNDLFYENNFLISNPGYENIRKNLDIQIERIINKFPHKPSRDYISENFSKKSAANKILSIYRQITQ